MRKTAIYLRVLWLLLLGWDGNRIVAHMRER
jgi:hypothetical protein